MAVKWPREVPMPTLLVQLVIFCVLLLPATAEAALSKQDRDELFSRVEEICRDASSIGSVLNVEGSLDAGATLKVLGVNATGKVNREQWQDIEQKYGEFRSNSTICKFEMIKLIQPLFGVNPPHNDDHTKALIN